MATISETLRAAIRDSGVTRYRIAQDTGVNESTLSRFIHGGALNTDNADRLAEYLGLELVARQAKTNASR